MTPLTFSFSENHDETNINLYKLSNLDISHTSWQKFAEEIATEPHLTPFPVNVLVDRWEKDYAAIAIKNDEIVSYISVLPTFSDLSRPKLSEEANLDYLQMPSINMYEFTTGWTRSIWRKKRISLQLRHRIIKRFNTSNSFFISIAIGIGASFVLEKLGWQILPWTQIAYVSSLNGWFRKDEAYKVGVGWLPIPGMKPYEGKHVSPYRNLEHDWEHFCHFWVSDVTLAIKLNEQLSKLMQQNLQLWREAIMRAFSE